MRLDAVLQAARLGGLAHTAMRGREFLRSLLGYLGQIWLHMLDLCKQLAQKLPRLIFIDIAIGPRLKQEFDQGFIIKPAGTHG